MAKYGVRKSDRVQQKERQGERENKGKSLREGREKNVRDRLS
jgi:hypothetical protein